MALINLACTLFDPIKITAVTSTPNFIIDTWHEYGLISNSLLRRIPGLDPRGSGRVMLSSGMSVNRPSIQVGIQIKNIRALPIELLVVDQGPADLLLGSQFLARLFDIGGHVTGVGIGSGGGIQPSITFSAPPKTDIDSLGLRLIPSTDTVESLQLEKFLRAARVVHNVGVLATTRLHQHDDWNHEGAKAESVARTIDEDASLGREQMLEISWVEGGSIWISLKSGSKSALSWLTQIFEKSTDARLRAAIANAGAAEEQLAVSKLTREEIAKAKTWEQRRLAANQIRQTREEWRKTVLGEVDFRRKLTEQISDETVRSKAIEKIDVAIIDLLFSDFTPIIENIPKIDEGYWDPLPAKLRERYHDLGE